MSVGDPDLDMFTEHAYRFSVFVPAALARTPQDRQVLRRALAAESPAYTQGKLVLVQPAMCLGRQSHLGLDSMLAAATPLRLTCAASIQSRPELGRRGGRQPHRRAGGARHIQDVPQLAARTAAPGRFAAARVVTWIEGGWS